MNCKLCDAYVSNASEATDHHMKKHPAAMFDPTWYVDGANPTTGYRCSGCDDVFLYCTYDRDFLALRAAREHADGHDALTPVEAVTEAEL